MNDLHLPASRVNMQKQPQGRRTPRFLLPCPILPLVCVKHPGGEVGRVSLTGPRTTVISPGVFPIYIHSKQFMVNLPHLPTLNRAPVSGMWSRRRGTDRCQPNLSCRPQPASGACVCVIVVTSCRSPDRNRRQLPASSQEKYPAVNSRTSWKAFLDFLTARPYPE